MPTYKTIATTTIGAGGNNTIEFTNIPQIYDDLVIKLSGRTTENDNATWALLDFNDYNITKNIRTLRADGSAVGTFTQTSGALVGYATGDTALASVFGNWEAYISRYSSTSYNKVITIQFVTENNVAANQLGYVSALWPSTSAITKLKLVSNSGVFKQHTTATLYGV